MPNRVRELRQLSGLSQRALAKKAGVSQSKVQRVEVESHPISLEQAKAFAAALGRPLLTVFPDLSERPQSTSVAPVARLMLRIALHDGITLAYEVDRAGVKEFYDSFDNPYLQCAGFTTGTLRVLINSVLIAFATASMELGAPLHPEETDPPSLRLYFAGLGKVQSDFNIDPDTTPLRELTDDEYAAGHTKAMQLQLLLTVMEDSSDEVEVLRLIDADNEDIMFREDAVAALEVRLDHIQPDGTLTILNEIPTEEMFNA